ncbi:MAG: ferritin family protein [bacterium]
MKMHVVAGSIAFVCMGLAGVSGAAEAAGKTTLDNLQAAFNGESNAKVRYEAFALKADEEGYKSVAALFRAAAASETIHARKHASVIKKLAAKPTSTIEEPQVKSTKENLEAAVAGETYEKDTMYPDFIKQAEVEKNKDALISFKGAMAAEAEHAKLYKQALDELDAWKPAGKEFMVCPVCGYTLLSNPALLKCPVCSTPKEKFAVIK